MFDTALIALASSAVVGLVVWYLVRRSQVGVAPPAVIQSIEHTFDGAINTVVDHVTSSIPRHQQIIVAAQHAIDTDLARAKDLVARLQAHIDANARQP